MLLVFFFFNVSTSLFLFNIFLQNHFTVLICAGTFASQCAVPRALVFQLFMQYSGICHFVKLKESSNDMHLKMPSFVCEYALYNMQFIFDEIFARQTLTALSVRRTVDVVAAGAGVDGTIGVDNDVNEEEKIALTLDNVRA